MATVFLSHRLSPKHALRAQLAVAGHRLVTRSMLRFETLEFELPQRTDWLFAYSRNGVESFFAKRNAHQWLSQNEHIRLAAIGLKTAEAWSAAGLAVEFVGTGEPSSTASAFVQIASGDTVTFVQAQESRGSVAALVEHEISIQTLVTYRAVSAAVDLPVVDLALVTSPRSAELFFEAINQALVPRVYCIGPTTAAAVEQMGHAVAGVAEVAEVEELLGLAMRELGVAGET